MLCVWVFCVAFNLILFIISREVYMELFLLFCILYLVSCYVHFFKCYLCIANMARRLFLFVFFSNHFLKMWMFVTFDWCWSLDYCSTCKSLALLLSTTKLPVGSVVHHYLYCILSLCFLFVVCACIFAISRHPEVASCVPLAQTLKQVLTALH